MFATLNDDNQATSKSDPMTQQPSSHLLSLPPELYEHVSIFLPTISITSLMMTNRYLRSIYEKALYRHINLYDQPNRSNALLRTFTLRPDLALLVRSLDINLRRSVVTTPSGRRTLSPTHPARLNALASARNVNSFGLSGIAWLWGMFGEDMRGIRGVVSKMRLTSLRIHGWWPSFSEPDLQYAARVSANLHEVLQGQPRLLNLEHKYTICNNEAQRVEIPVEIQNSDIASLRTLNARVDTFPSLFPAVGDQLESMVIADWRDDNSTFSATSLSNFTAVTGRIRKLHLLLQRDGPRRGWHLNFGPVLGSFPNIESLRITGLLDFTTILYPEYLDPFFEKVTSQITNAPNLTKLEISFEYNQTRCEPDPSDLYEIREELRLNLKRSCPSLKRFIDPAQQEWVFLPTNGEGGGDAFQAIKVGRLYHKRTQFRGGDLPGLQWDV